MIVREKGFSLVEVLVTLTLFSNGLLGVTKLQIHTLALVRSVNHHSALVRAGSNLAEAMRANREGSIKGYYQHSEATDLPPAPDCHLSACTSRELASFDLANTRLQLAKTQPGARSSIQRVASSSLETIPRFLISLYWGGGRESEHGETCSSAKRGEKNLSCWQIELGIKKEDS